LTGQPANRHRSEYEKFVSMSEIIKSLPGFRDFLPLDAARRNVITSTWRQVARQHGFHEFDGPMLETLDLYARKNEGGEEILKQLYRFEDGGGRSVALRPEMTPTLARIIGAREKDFRKPIKWFSSGSFFRYERQQKGRLREFLQLNCDLLGDSSPAADAELLALAVNTLRAFGLTSEDIVVRISHRGAWADFLKARGLNPDQSAQVLQVVDKIERENDETLQKRLEGTSLTLKDLKAFIEDSKAPALEELISDFHARGLADYLNIDLSIVRGLAYYTGFVFEIFDRRGEHRALAGGGRYDGLVKALGGGKADLPAVGFGMGDVVLANLLDSLPHTKARLAAASNDQLQVDLYVIIADEGKRGEALRVIERLRSAGKRVEFPLASARVGKQFQAAEACGAKLAVIIGSEFPNLKIKDLSNRQEIEIPEAELADWIKTKHSA